MIIPISLVHTFKLSYHSFALLSAILCTISTNVCFTPSQTFFTYSIFSRLWLFQYPIKDKSSTNTLVLNLKSSFSPSPSIPTPGVFLSQLFLALNLSCPFLSHTLWSMIRLIPSTAVHNFSIIHEHAQIRLVHSD